MPKALHDKLAREARKKGYKGKRAAAYVYGTMTNIEKRARGEPITPSDIKRKKR